MIKSQIEIQNWGTWFSLDILPLDCKFSSFCSEALTAAVLIRTWPWTDVIMPAALIMRLLSQYTRPSLQHFLKFDFYIIFYNFFLYFFYKCSKMPAALIMPVQCRYNIPDPRSLQYFFKFDSVQSSQCDCSCIQDVSSKWKPILWFFGNCEIVEGI